MPEKAGPADGWANTTSLACAPRRCRGCPFCANPRFVVVVGERIVELGYDDRRFDGKSGPYEIEPLHLLAYHGNLYVLARSRGSDKTFALSRLGKVSPTGNASSAPPGSTGGSSVARPSRSHTERNPSASGSCSPPRRHRHPRARLASQSAPPRARARETSRGTGMIRPAPFALPGPLLGAADYPLFYFMGLPLFARPATTR